MPGPHWLTAWVKLNNKHLAGGGSLQQHQQQQQSHQSPKVLKRRQSSSGEDDDPTVQTTPTSAAASSSTATSAARDNANSPSSSSSPFGGRRLGAGRRSRSRSIRSGGGLQKTKSASDLIREMAIGSEQQHDQNTNIPGAGGTDRNHHHPANNNFLAGTGRFLNETAFVAQLQQKQRAANNISNDNSNNSSGRRIVVQPEGGKPPITATDPAPSLPPPPDAKSVVSSSVASSTQSTRGTVATAGSDMYLGGQGRLNLEHLLPPNFLAACGGGGGGSRGDEDRSSPCCCSRCESLEEQLHAADQELEYLRSVAVRTEQQQQQQRKPSSSATTASGIMERESPEKTAATAPPPPPLNGTSATTLKDTSKQLTEVTRRHKKQIEQLTRERSRWQQDMHFKIQKFAHLSAELNTEAAVRNKNAIALQKELTMVKSERDGISEELVRLRAGVEASSKTEVEYEEAKRRLVECEADGLQHAREAIRARDETIDELSSKLQLALDELALERAQRQRRQIIFPREPHPSSS